jgi:hypothetical protein
MKTPSHRGDRLTRRALLESSLATVAVTTAVVAAPRLAHAGRHRLDAAEGESASEPTLALVAGLGLQPGLGLGAWTVLDVQPRARSIALMVAGPEAEPYQLDVLARDPSRPGVTDTRFYSVFLVNGGNGDTTSDEQRARGALAVGHYLRWAEARHAALPRLVTMSERLRDPDGNYRLA